MKNKKLTPKQQRFCDEYVKDLNGAQAAIRAGYSKGTAKEIASENLTKPNIQEYIQNKQKTIGKKNNLSAEWVIKKLKKVLRRCMQEEAVIDKLGHPTGEFVFKESGATKSLELIGRHLGMFNDKRIIATDPDNPLKVEHVQIYIPDNGRDKK